jgi:hypothetical protein
MVHTPLKHDGLLNGHTLPQKPQLLLSFIRLTQVPEQSVSPGGQSVVDVVLSGVVEVVLVDDGGVVVVGGLQSPVVRSQASPEQHTVSAEQGSLLRVQHPQLPSDSGSQRSY